MPERFWTCDGIGQCDSDDHPETLAAWKIDVATPRYSMCRRDGSECGDWQPLIQGLDIGFLVVLHENSWNPETFKIERLSGKFAAVRISGTFLGADLKTPDLSMVRVMQRTGSCLAVQK